MSRAGGRLQPDGRPGTSWTPPATGKPVDKTSRVVHRGTGGPVIRRMGMKDRQRERASASERERQTDEQRRLTDRELDVMSILWRKRSGTVAEVRERLQE